MMLKLKRRASRAKPHKVYTRTCVECGEEFETPYMRKITCSARCNNNRHIRQMRAWRRRQAVEARP